MNCLEWKGKAGHMGEDDGIVQGPKENRSEGKTACVFKFLLF